MQLSGQCRDLGLVLGISRSRVANLAADGVLPRAGRGLFDLPACVQAYLKHKLVLAKAGDGTTQAWWRSGHG